MNQMPERPADPVVEALTFGAWFFSASLAVIFIVIMTFPFSGKVYEVDLPSGKQTVLRLSPYHGSLTWAGGGTNSTASYRCIGSVRLFIWEKWDGVTFTKDSLTH